jgi:hypothetical protein
VRYAAPLAARPGSESGTWGRRGGQKARRAQTTPSAYLHQRLPEHAPELHCQAYLRYLRYAAPLKHLKRRGSGQVPEYNIVFFLV